MKFTDLFYEAQYLIINLYLSSVPGKKPKASCFLFFLLTMGGGWFVKVGRVYLTSKEMVPPPSHLVHLF